MRQALKLVYRFIRDIDPVDQFVGVFAAWLAFVNPRDVLAFRLALEAPGDRVLDPPPRRPAIDGGSSALMPWLPSAGTTIAATGAAFGENAIRASSQP